MTIKAGGRSVLLLATGLFVCFAGPSPAAPAADDNAVTDAKSASAEKDGAAKERVAAHKYTRHSSRYWKRHAQRKYDRTALKSSTTKKADAPDDAADSASTSTAIPPTVANANAQLAAANTPDSPLAGNARAMSARANDIMQAAPSNAASNANDAQPATEAEVTSPDQLNEVDRTLPADTPPEPTIAMAMAHSPTATETASSDEGSTWDQASLIGKIFIGFGALLTMASAARMMMA
jgi:hypothetical protein